jgi:hypothetical protein
MYRAVCEDVRKCSGSTAFANTVGKIQSWSWPLWPHLRQVGIRSVRIEELIISTRSGAPERSPAGRATKRAVKGSSLDGVLRPPQ